MSGSNGLHPVVNLKERQKCPAHPSKRKWTSHKEAQEAAVKSSRQSKLTIIAYMCEACGHYHLTRSLGGDSVTLPGGQFSVGEFKAKAPHHPVFASSPDDDLPLVPGDHETRVKFARRYLEQNPEPTSEEMCEAIGGCTKETLRRVMKELNYRNTRGRFARWVPNPPPAPDPRLADEPETAQGATEAEPDTRTPLDLSYDNDAPEEPPAVWQGGRERPWRAAREVEVERIRHIPLGDLLDTYSSAGYRLVLTLEDLHG